MSEIHFNPGKKLRDLILKIYPYDENEKSIHMSLDKAFKLEKSLHYYSYMSMINFVFKRIVCYAKYLYKKKNNFTESFYSDIEIFLRYKSEIPEMYYEQIKSLLVEIIKYNNKKITKNKRKGIIEATDFETTKCYLSSNNLLEEELYTTRISDSNIDSNVLLKPELDHIWPKSYGGPTENDNLKFACAKYNIEKGNFIDKYDYHYEDVVFEVEPDSESFNRCLKVIHKIALGAKNEYKCSNDDIKLSDADNIKIVKIDEDDCSHFFNLEIINEKRSQL